MPSKRASFVTTVTLEGQVEGEAPPDLVVHAFDVNGQYLASAPVEKGQAALGLPDGAENRTLRLFVGPKLPDKEKPSDSGSAIRRTSRARASSSTGGVTARSATPTGAT
jgi:hypothetical protein